VKLTSLVVNRPGYDRHSTQTFTNTFIDLCKSADFECYRYYNVQSVWDGEPTYPQTTQWSMRKTPRSASQRTMAASTGQRDGWCWEYIVELANTLKKDIWICLHMSCDSVYVATLAQMLKDSLYPSINIYVENSNEVWSPTQLTHGPYNAASASTRGITFDDNYAHRTVQLSQWFGQVFGSDAINSRIRVVLAGQHGYHARSDNHLRYIDRVFGPPKNHIYATSTALYFGSTQADNTDPLAINAGMLADINSQITNTQSATYRKNHIEKAAQWELTGGCTSYEGGPHLPAGGGTTNLGPQITSHRTERMGDVIKLNYRQGWQDLNGGLAMYFTLVSGYNRYGCWGITDDPSKPHRNFKMAAIQDLTKQANTSAVEADAPYRFAARIDQTTSTLRLSIKGAMLSSRDTVEMFDILGRKVFSASVSEPSSSYALTFTPVGIYVVKVGDWVCVTYYAQ